MKLHAGVATLTGLCLAAAVGLGGLEEPAECFQTAGSVVVGWTGLDALLRAHADLRGRVVLMDEQGMTIEEHAIDFADPVMPAHVSFAKTKGRTHASVRLVVTAEGRTLTDRVLALGAPVTPDVRLATDGAPGGSIAGSHPPAEGVPVVKLPNLEKAEPVQPGPVRTVKLCDFRRRVASDRNYPTVYAMAPIANQTAAPDDPKHKSVYITASNYLYDAKTGRRESILNYLIEIPIDPAWLKKGEDEVVDAAPQSVRVHIPLERVKLSESEAPVRVTGERPGGLTQTAHQAAVGEDGNLYFGVRETSPIRFNVRKARFEAPPVSTFTWYMKRAPAAKDLGAAAGRRLDFDYFIYPHNGRLWVLHNRYMVESRSKDVFLSPVLSIPMADWGDAKAFEAGMRLNAEPQPGTPRSLWDVLPRVDEDTRRLGDVMARGNRMLLFSYNHDVMWVMDTDDAGNTTKLVRIDSVAGRRVVKYAVNGSWLSRGAQTLGFRVGAQMEGESKETPLWLPSGEYALSAKPPSGEGLTEWSTSAEFTQKRHMESSRGPGYGVAKYRKANFCREMGVPAVEGFVTIRYDSTGVIARDPAYAGVLAQMTAASAGPEFQWALIPGTEGRGIGISDYPAYYVASFDWSGNGPVEKRHLPALAETDQGAHGLAARMGPYCHLWIREKGEESLYLAGYTGIARLPWSVGGKTQERFRVQMLTRWFEKVSPADSATPGPIRWITSMIPGLGGKLIITGYDDVSRGATAYSGGVRWIDRGAPERQFALSAMTRGFKSRDLCSRLRGKAGGGWELEVFVPGEYSGSYANLLPAAQRPTSQVEHVFVYADTGAGLEDRYGFALGAGQRVTDAVVARGTYLLLLMADGALTTYDIDSRRFVDGVRLPGTPAQGGGRRCESLMSAPGGAFAAAVQGPEAGFTLFRLEVARSGRIDATATLKCAAEDRGEYKSVMLLQSDGKGGATLFVAPPMQSGESCLTIIPGALPAR